MSATDALDTEIRSMVTELIGSAPLPPSSSELEKRDVGPHGRRNRQDRWSNRRPRRWAVASAFSVAVVTLLLVVLLIPSATLAPPSAAAAVLRHLANQAVAAAPAPILKDGQWLQSEFQVSYQAVPLSGGSRSGALRSTRAVVTTKAQDWTNDLSQYCSLQVVTSVTYGSPASRRAWQSNRNRLPPALPPQCASGYLGSGNHAPGIPDVARLSTDPTTLARVIEAGTTGLPVLDQPLPGNHHLTPFGRAVILLVGPTLGATPAFWSALLRAMATMPGVALLGTETTHRGGTGVALVGATGEGYRTTIVLSPSSGALLEARNLLVGQLVAGLPFGALAIQWLDPVGTPHVVDTTMLPAPLAGQVPTGIVSALTDPGVSLSRWNKWLSTVLPGVAGNPTAGAGATNTRGMYAVSVVTRNPDPDIAGIARLFQASGLVHGIRSAEG
jgi:hypothetical protein